MAAFENAYRVEWYSLRACTEDFAESIGLYGLAEGADSPYITVDMDMLEYDFRIDVYTVETADRGVYVFDPNA